MIRVYDALIRGLAGLSGAIIAAICLLIIWDVAARNFGLQPPASTVALTEYGLLYFTMAAAPWLVRQRGHIAVEILYRRVSAPHKHRLDRFILTACALICLTVSALAGLLTSEAFQRSEVEIRSLDAPRWALFLPLSLGFGLMAMEYLRLLIGGESAMDSDGEQRETF